jgi:hypothetical protein
MKCRDALPFAPLSRHHSSCQTSFHHPDTSKFDVLKDSFLDSHTSGGTVQVSMGKRQATVADLVAQAEANG